MKPTPLLDFWQKPAGAGEPVALLATTFALEPDFFEQNCLARFLEVSSVNEEAGSVDDIVASVELHELLQNAGVSVLADRSAPVQRTSLLWDLLSCKVDGGLLHAKVSVLVWEKATRVILGSANLTAAGYRRQIELGLAVDLGSGCLFPPEVLHAIADELESYLPLVPGFDPDAAVFLRAANTLALFRQRISRQAPERAAIRVAFAPTNADVTPLGRMSAVWNGPHPLRATHLSPFWDSNDSNRTALMAVKGMLSGRPASARSQKVAIVLGPRGQIAFSRHLREGIDDVRQLQQLDNEIRALHAKCLLVESDEWVAALVGSSNHTIAGLGLTHRRHREMNVWIGAQKSSKEGKGLLELIQLGERVPEDAEEVEPKDEDEAVLPALPACFGVCAVGRHPDDRSWALHLGIASSGDMPESWAIRLGDESILTRDQWAAERCPSTAVIGLKQGVLPMYVLVTWDDISVPWAVVADDRHGLPPGPTLSSLRAQHLLDALATGRSLAQVLREELELKAAEADADIKMGPEFDPLKRHELQGSLLRKGRALAASLSAMQRRLDRPVISAETLRARLASPLGPEFVASKVIEAYEAGQQTRAEIMFTIAEIVLTVGRVNWTRVFEHIDRTEGFAMVKETLERLDVMRGGLGDEPTDLAAYAHRAIKEARECLVS
ncbi:phospholipase D-like domain-containing protein [Paraburkholderia kururiensis]|uniref:hypothetical protein n=1 Tax=Paraburkholderia kururiensis TaxID=984307 RepID=UPI0018F52EBA|nr:hypothetical protein [Paraburkholderia kururiensis]